MNNSIHPTDQLLVTASRGARTFVTFSLQGATSLGDVFRRVKDGDPGISGGGVVSLQLRNRTQGWTSRHTIVMPRKPTVPAPAPNLPEGTQLRLFC